MSYGGDEESKLGSGTIYATPTFGKITNGIPRYDFVVVFSDSKNATDEIAQVITFLKVAKHNKDGLLIDRAYFAIVKYLKVKRNDNKKIKKCKFPRYEWNSAEPLGLIQFDAIVGPAFVVPVMSKTKNVIAGAPQKTDEFVYVERKFTDRSGWSDISANMEDSGLIFPDLSTQKDFLISQQSSNSLLAKMVSGLPTEVSSKKPTKKDFFIDNKKKKKRTLVNDDDENENEEEEEEDEEEGEDEEEEEEEEEEQAQDWGYRDDDDEQ
jgi:hypothetical protein